MKANLELVFSQLRQMLRKRNKGLSVKEDTPLSFCLEARVGPSTIEAWKGKLRMEKIPVAWVQVGKGYVSFHLMGLDKNPNLQEALSEKLRSHMQGKTCFNFKNPDQILFEELEQVTHRAIDAFRKAGYVAD